MASPEQSQPGRTGRTELDTRARSAPVSPSAPDRFGPEPEANQPGHHPPEEQDQPPLDDFAARFGITPDSSPSDGGEQDTAAPPEGTGEQETAAPPEDGGDGDGAASPEVAHRDDAPSSNPVRQVWSVAVRRCVLPALGGVRSLTVFIERAARDSIR
jgi:hypothetical protein